MRTGAKLYKGDQTRRRLSKNGEKATLWEQKRTASERQDLQSIRFISGGSRAYLKCRKAYAIMPVGKKDESAHCGTQKAPELRPPGLFYSRCGKVAYALGWLPPIYLRPAICRCSRRLHLPRQRVRKTKIYSWWHTPFLYLYRGGSVAHYTIVAEMPQEAISPCLLSEP